MRPLLSRPDLIVSQKKNGLQKVGVGDGTNLYLTFFFLTCLFPHSMISGVADSPGPNVDIP
jgi:hypothetical protein